MGMVENPAAGETPLNLVATGHCSVDRAIFDALRRIESGARGELQFAGVINLFISVGYSFHVVARDGILHNLGNPAGGECGIPHPKRRPALFSSREALLEKYLGESG